MVALLKLIRWPNLVLIVLTQYAMRYWVIKPAIEFPALDLVFKLSFIHFNLLVLATVCIAAAGYIINDYFDLKIDRFNKPSQMQLGISISRKKAIKLHWIFTLIGLLLSFYVCYINHYISIFYVFAFVSGSLWFYSTSFKHMPLLGNVMIAFMIALVPLVTAMLDLVLIQEAYRSILIQQAYQLLDTVYLILGFSAFAFLYNLAREIVKDMADVEGDAKGGSPSIAVAWGLKTAKKIVYVLLLIALSLILYVPYSIFTDFRSIIYILGLIAIPTIYTAFLLFKAQNRSSYLNVSNNIKIILLLGIGYAFIFKLNLS